MQWKVGYYTLCINQDCDKREFQISITEDGCGSTIMVPPEALYNLVCGDPKTFGGYSKAYQTGIKDGINIAIKQLVDVQKEHKALKRLECD